MSIPNFEPFPKIPRLNREMVVKEKIDGTNAVVYIEAKCKRCGLDYVHNRPVGDNEFESCCGYDSPPTVSVYTGSKNQWITPETDNFGFAAWARDNAEDLKKLGPGMHRGEWHGSGINGNRYGLKDKRFALFDHKYHDEWRNKLPSCCSVVPVLLRDQFSTYKVGTILGQLRERGSVMYPGKPAEGLVVWLPAAQMGFKATCLNDAISKGEAEALSRARP